MEFANKTWSPYTRCAIEKLVNVQRRVTKLIPAVTHLPYEDRLSRFNPTTLEERRSRGEMTEVFKILHVYDWVRGNYLQLATRHSHLVTQEDILKVRKPNTAHIGGICSRE